MGKRSISLIFLTTFYALAICQDSSIDKEAHLKVDGIKVPVSTETLIFAKRVKEFSQGEKLENYFEINCEGFLIVDFGKEMQENKIYLSGNNLSNNNLISISKNGENWIELGSISKNQLFIDLKNKIPKKETYKFLRIQNSTNCSKEKCKAIMIEAIAIDEPKKNQSKVTHRITSQEIKTKNEVVILKIKDIKYFDGDILTIYLNGRKLFNKKLITKRGKIFIIQLDEGLNKLKIYVNGDGIIKETTVKVKVVDELVSYERIFHLKKKTSKTIKILKE